MFSVRQKRAIARDVELALRKYKHPEMQGPDEPLKFHLRVDGIDSDSFANIKPNSEVPVPDYNSHNERMDKNA